MLIGCTTIIINNNNNGYHKRHEDEDMRFRIFARACQAISLHFMRNVGLFVIVTLTHGRLVVGCHCGYCHCYVIFIQLLIVVFHAPLFVTGCREELK